jgi:hypothetical protein
MTSLHSLATLVLSLAALAFVVWIAAAYSGVQHSVYGPAPAAAISA